MANGIKLPPSVVSLPKPSTGTTGTQSAFQPGKPQAAAPAQAVQKPQDAFGSAQTASAAQAQLSGRDEIRAPGQLASDLKGVVDAEQLPGRLEADLAVNLPELISLLSLTRQQKATRLVEFMLPYAEKLADLAQQAASTAAPMPAEQREKVGEQLLQPMREAGLEQVVELTTGKTGVEVAEQLLSANTPQDVKQLTETMKFDAPQWASRPEAQNANEVKRGEPSLIAQPTLAPPREQRGPGRAEEEEAATKDRKDKKLGSNMIWNTLHMFRGGDAEDLTPEKQKELVMATGAIVVMVVVVFVAVALALILK